MSAVGQHCRLGFVIMRATHCSLLLGKAAAGFSGQEMSPAISGSSAGLGFMLCGRAGLLSGFPGWCGCRLCSVIGQDHWLASLPYSLLSYWEGL